MDKIISNKVIYTNFLKLKIKFFFQQQIMVINVNKIFRSVREV